MRPLSHTRVVQYGSIHINQEGPRNELNKAFHLVSQGISNTKNILNKSRNFSSTPFFYEPLKSLKNTHLFRSKTSKLINPNFGSDSSPVSILTPIDKSTDNNVYSQIWDCKRKFSDSYFFNFSTIKEEKKTCEWSEDLFTNLNNCMHLTFCNNYEQRFPMETVIDLYKVDNRLRENLDHEYNYFPQISCNEKRKKLMTKHSSKLINKHSIDKHIEKKHHYQVKNNNPQIIASPKVLPKKRKTGSSVVNSNSTSKSYVYDINKKNSKSLSKQKVDTCSPSLSRSKKDALTSVSPNEKVDLNFFPIDGLRSDSISAMVCDKFYSVDRTFLVPCKDVSSNGYLSESIKVCDPGAKIIEDTCKFKDLNELDNADGKFQPPLRIANRSPPASIKPTMLCDVVSNPKLPPDSVACDNAKKTLNPVLENDSSNYFIKKDNPKKLLECIKLNSAPKEVPSEDIAGSELSSSNLITSLDQISMTNSLDNFSCNSGNTTPGNIDVVKNPEHILPGNRLNTSSDSFKISPENLVLGKDSNKSAENLCLNTTEYLSGNEENTASNKISITSTHEDYFVSEVNALSRVISLKKTPEYLAVPKELKTSTNKPHKTFSGNELNTSNNSCSFSEIEKSFIQNALFKSSDRIPLKNLGNLLSVTEENTFINEISVKKIPKYFSENKLYVFSENIALDKTPSKLLPVNDSSSDKVCLNKKSDYLSGNQVNSSSGKLSLNKTSSVLPINEVIPDTISSKSLLLENKDNTVSSLISKDVLENTTALSKNNSYEKDSSKPDASLCYDISTLLAESNERINDMGGHINECKNQQNKTTQHFLKSKSSLLNRFPKERNDYSGKTTLNKDCVKKDSLDTSFLDYSGINSHYTNKFKLAGNISSSSTRKCILYNTTVNEKLSMINEDNKRSILDTKQPRLETFAKNRIKLNKHSRIRQDKHSTNCYSNKEDITVNNMLFNSKSSLNNDTDYHDINCSVINISKAKEIIDKSPCKSVEWVSSKSDLGEINFSGNSNLIISKNHYNDDHDLPAMSQSENMKLVSLNDQDLENINEEIKLPDFKYSTNNEDYIKKNNIEQNYKNNFNLLELSGEVCLNYISRALDNEPTVESVPPFEPTFVHLSEEYDEIKTLISSFDQRKNSLIYFLEEGKIILNESNRTNFVEGNTCLQFLNKEQTLPFENNNSKIPHTGFDVESFQEPDEGLNFLINHQNEFCSLVDSSKQFTSMLSENLSDCQENVIFFPHDDEQGIDKKCGDNIMAFNAPNSICPNSESSNFQENLCFQNEPLNFESSKAKQNDQPDGFDAFTKDYRDADDNLFRSNEVNDCLKMQEQSVFSFDEEALFTNKFNNMILTNTFYTSNEERSSLPCHNCTGKYEISDHQSNTSNLNSRCDSNVKSPSSNLNMVDELINEADNLTGSNNSKYKFYSNERVQDTNLDNFIGTSFPVVSNEPKRTISPTDPSVDGVKAFNEKAIVLKKYYRVRLKEPQSLPFTCSTISKNESSTENNNQRLFHGVLDNNDKCKQNILNTVNDIGEVGVKHKCYYRVKGQSVKYCKSTDCPQTISKVDDCTKIYSTDQTTLIDPGIWKYVLLNRGCPGVINNNIDNNGPNSDNSLNKESVKRSGNEIKVVKTEVNPSQPDQKCKVEDSKSSDKIKRKYKKPISPDVLKYILMFHGMDSQPNKSDKETKIDINDYSNSNNERSVLDEVRGGMCLSSGPMESSNETTEHDVFTNQASLFPTINDGEVIENTNYQKNIKTFFVGRSKDHMNDSKTFNSSGSLTNSDNGKKNDGDRHPHLNSFGNKSSSYHSQTGSSMSINLKIIDSKAEISIAENSNSLEPGSVIPFVKTSFFQMSGSSGKMKDEISIIDSAKQKIMGFQGAKHLEAVKEINGEIHSNPNILNNPVLGDALRITSGPYSHTDNNKKETSRSHLNIKKEFPFNSDSDTNLNGSPIVKMNDFPNINIQLHIADKESNHSVSTSTSGNEIKPRSLQPTQTSESFEETVEKMRNKFIKNTLKPYPNLNVGKLKSKSEDLKLVRSFQDLDKEADANKNKSEIMQTDPNDPLNEKDMKLLENYFYSKSNPVKKNPLNKNLKKSSKYSIGKGKINNKKIKLSNQMIDSVSKFKHLIEKYANENYSELNQYTFSVVSPSEFESASRMASMNRVTPINDVSDSTISSFSQLKRPNKKMAFATPAHGIINIDLLSNPILKEKYSSIPSVTKILNDTMSEASKKNLTKWKSRMMEVLGEKKFEEFYKAQLELGEKFHRSVKNRLLNKNEKTDSLCLKSIEWILKDITDVVAVESFVAHPFLGYKGILDCIVKYKSKPVLIEWKHSSKRKMSIKSTYDAPLQMCAYMGALSEDKNYNFQVESGMIVVAHDDGSPAELFSVNSEECQQFWSLWLKRLSQYIASNQLKMAS